MALLYQSVSHETEKLMKKKRGSTLGPYMRTKTQRHGETLQHFIQV